MSTATHLLTAEELFLRSEDETRWCELVDGELVPMSPPGGVHGVVDNALALVLATHVKAKRLGIVIGEAGFIISRNPDTVLAPDGAFLRKKATGQIPKAYFSVAPALVWEVVSPGDTVTEVAEKMRRWLNAGVELAWVVDPFSRAVTVYQALDDIRVLTEKDMLTGGTVVPGFECPVAELFADL